MTQEGLREVMKYHLRNFNTKDIEITDDTIHNEVLSDSDGIGNATSKRIYRLFIRFTIVDQGHVDKPWPGDWFENSVYYLSTKLI